MGNIRWVGHRITTDIYEGKNPCGIWIRRVRNNPYTPIQLQIFILKYLVAEGFISSSQIKYIKDITVDSIKK